MVDGRRRAEARADVVLIATGAHAAGAARRGAGRRADPHLAAGLRPDRAARAPDRGRLRGHRRRVRQRLPGDGLPVTLVSSRDRVLPDEDTDAADVIEEVFRRRGMNVLSRSRAASVHRDRRRRRGHPGRRPDGRRLALPDDGRLGAQHRRARPGARSASALDGRGYVEVDRVSRTSAPGVYAAGDCTGVLMLASVAAMQGRIAMWHALGEAVAAAAAEDTWPPPCSPTRRSPPSASRRPRWTAARCRARR